MNILVLNNTSDLYGGSRILSIVVSILAERKHRPIVILSENGPLTAELDKLGVEWRIIRLGILRRKYLSLSGILNRISVTSKAWKALNKVVDQEKIDLIYSNTTGVFIGAFLAKRRKIKHIWHVHEIIKKPAAFTRILGYLLGKYSDLVIVVSDAVKNHWKNHINGAPIERIYNGINTVPFEQKQGELKQELNIPKDALLILMIGRVNHWKGHHYFIDIAQLIHQQYKNVHFVLAGDAYPGNEHLVEKLENRINNLSFKQKVQYIGYREDIPNLLSSADLFVLPSTQPDPFPTVILEAMASSTCVAATAHGGALEMIDPHKTGIHIPFDDAVNAAHEIGLILNEVTLKHLGALGRDRIQQHFSLEAFKNNIIEAFETVNRK
ncbi:glycosyltransferase family 4 protein [Pedobacter flavus]|uniref:Glycosyltransferase family 4 protein n=1 Tax=Pedobacter flavus TaxID=3113906 RepID=A0ABU7H0D1_9SPHI|nr:glycosyltransferase family 4 protein [Pedobacter sp. VNH31]MEE1884742.1 glycosyltransferase family 4 protein [Pedobacter sp. VNH31]